MKVLSYLAVIDSSITKINTSKYYSFYYYDVIGKLVSTGRLSENPLQPFFVESPLVSLSLTIEWEIIPLKMNIEGDR
jgi:hypothetical protein